MKIDLNLIRRWADEISTSDDRDNEAGFIDTLDGACDAAEVADWLIDGILSDEALTEAIKAQEALLKSRRDRIEARAKTKRRVAVELLEAAGLKKMERPRATISRLAGRIGVSITDEASIPSQLCVTKTITIPDKAAIKAQLEAGETVPGAELVRGHDSLSVRAA